MLKAMRRLPVDLRQRLSTAIKALPDGDVKRLTGGEERWRLRVGDWRVLFDADDKAKVITVVGVSARGDAYKKR